MPVTDVTDVVYNLDSFWGFLTLNELRNLMSSSKKIRADFLVTTTTAVKSSGKKRNIVSVQNPLLILEHALLTMIKTRPNALSGWTVKISDAKYHFSLQNAAIIKCCAALPLGDRCRIDDIVQWKPQWFDRIHFIDAFRLMTRSPGIKTAMERRHKFDVSVLDSAYTLVEKVAGRYKLMEQNVSKARDEVNKSLDNILKRNELCRDTRIEINLRKGVRLLDDLKTGIVCADIDIWILSRIHGKKINILETKNKIKELKTSLTTLVARYKNHCKYCPEIMTLDCLNGLM